MYKILIIEDDLTMAQAIQKEMKMWGNDAQYVQDFKNVLETFAEFDPHLVLMDITLSVSMARQRSPASTLRSTPL